MCPPNAATSVERTFPAGAALVVGGSGGLGAACADALARAGSAVAITWRRRESVAGEVADAARAHGVEASTHRFDVAGEGAAEALMAEVVATHGVVHTLVWAAGSPIDLPRVGDATPEAWRHVMRADADGFFDGVRAALPALRTSRGSIVFVSSAGLGRHPPGDVLSVAPKAACEALVRAVAREEGRHGVRANSVRPGMIESGMFHELVARGELDERWLDAARRNIALRRFGGANDVAEAVVFLASSRARYITGQALAVDGGYAV